MTAFRDQFDHGPASEPHGGAPSALPSQEAHEPDERPQWDGAERERLEALIRDQRRELERVHRVALLHGVAAGLVHKLNQPLACVQLTLASCINRAMKGELTGDDAVTELSDAMA